MKRVIMLFTLIASLTLVSCSTGSTEAAPASDSTTVGDTAGRVDTSACNTCDSVKIDTLVK
jgi:hypothetical protein